MILDMSTANARTRAPHPFHASVVGPLGPNCCWTGGANAGFLPAPLLALAGANRYRACGSRFLLASRLLTLDHAFRARHHAHGSEPSVGGGLLDHFAMEFNDGLAHDLQHRNATRSQVIVAPAARSRAGLYFAPQPAIAFHAFQQRVQRTWADVVPVTAKLAEHPLA